MRVSRFTTTTFRIYSLMAVTTVVRVKRRLEDDPAEALVLSFKRKRTNEDSSKEDCALLKFAGTLTKKDDSAINAVVHKFKTKEELSTSFKSHPIDILSRQRDEQRSRSKENRFRVLSLNRSDCSGSEDLSVPLAIVDVDVDTDTDLVPRDDGAIPETNTIEYVYDLYSNCREDDFDDTYMESFLSIQPIYTLEEVNDDNESIVDEEDSNDEGNWRNDYPDSDHSINGDDMRLAANMKGLGIDDGYDLSSDSEDNEYLAMSGITSRGYDAYKARVTREMKGDADELSSSYSDAEEDE